MAPWSANKEQPHGHPEEQGLSTLLTPEQGGELTLLIVNIIDVMRKQITDTFDASITSAKQPQQALHVSGPNPSMESTEPHEETDEEKEARKLREKREEELSAPQQQELKKAYLEYLEAWQQSVITRVGEVVNSKKTAEEQRDEVKSSPSPETTTIPDKTIGMEQSLGTVKNEVNWLM
jgi:hypothetical protein